MSMHSAEDTALKQKVQALEGTAHVMQREIQSLKTILAPSRDQQSTHSSKGRKTRSQSAGLPHLPGPKGLPLIVALLSITVKEPLVMYTEWAKMYDSFFALSSLLEDIVIISSEKMARIFGDERSNISAGRSQPSLYRMYVVAGCPQGSGGQQEETAVVT
ncbi:hypothetical protein BU15DRAFT_82183 [Melanogaster broomeanus]|nr:hypothetical protein BU15DRAFT_82183 [Melanogaster broomeanus]